MIRAPLDYDAADDGAKSYLAAIEAKRLRGDNYYLRQPDDPGVEHMPVAARAFSSRLILLAALTGLAPVAVFAAVMWWGMG